MKIMPVGELKRHFSEVLADIQNGEQIVISYGRKKTKVAVVIPFSQYEKGCGVKLGLLSNKVKCEFADDFEMTIEELVDT